MNGVLFDTAHWKKLLEVAVQKSGELKIELLKTIIDAIDFSKYENALKVAEALSIPVKTKKLTLELTSITNGEYVREWLLKNININSPKQIREIFRNLFHLDIVSTDERILKQYKNVPIIGLLLNYREHTKKETTYGANFLEGIHPKTGRIHAEYNQIGTVTGRFSVARFHQMPKESEYRRAVIARPGYKFITADYNQQEFRIAGAVSGDKRIIDAYIRGDDIHLATAQLLYKIKEVTGEQRGKAKNINFAILYDSSAWGLSFKLDISLTEAEEIMSALMTGYPTYFEFRREAQKVIWEKKFSATPLGRKRYFVKQTVFNDDNEFFRYKGKVCREGFNVIIQGCAADITKIAFGNLYLNNPFGEENFRELMQVHDEIDSEGKEELIPEIVEFVDKTMCEAEQPFLRAIPAKVDITVKDYWSK